MDAEVIKLIEAIKSKPVLYDSKINEFHSPVAKQEAWEQVSQQIHIPAEEAKTKWIRLRKCLISAMNRRRKNNTMTPWKYHKEMNFLLPYLEYKTSEPLDVFADVNKDDRDYEEEEEEEEDNNAETLLEIERVRDETKSSSCFIDLDEMDMFFLSLAKTVKRLPEYDQSRVKLLVSNVVLKTHMRRNKRTRNKSEEPSDSDSDTSLSRYLTAKKERTD